MILENMSDQNELDIQYMSQAIQEARLAGEVGEVPVGAVVVHAGKVIGHGHNFMIKNNDPTAHAEIVAIRESCTCQNNYRLPGATIYVTLEPCIMCMGAIIQARIERLVFGAYDFKTGAAGSLYDIGADGELNHRVEIHGGVMIEDCSTLLKDFFRARRKARKG
ncbi:MAG: tRNA adenosine(34) deaminase TadA [Desulfotalea sp.]